jgi:hypothetical protein
MMEGGPLRGPRPTERRTARPEATQRQSREPQPVAETSAAAPRSISPHHVQSKKRPLKRWLWPLVISATVIVLGVIGWVVWSQTRKPVMPIDTGKYQAVFFTNGQVYFGKLEAFNDEYMKLRDIYYLQTQANSQDDEPKNPQQTASDQNGVQLIKLGDEVHGPEDEMVISKSQVLFYENLKTDGTVAQSIEKHKNSQ